MRESQELVWNVFGELVWKDVSAAIGLVVDISLIFDVVIGFGEEVKDDAIISTLQTG